MTKCPSPRNSFAGSQTCDTSCQPARHKLTALSFDKLKGLPFLSFSHFFKFSKGNSLLALLAANLQSRLSVEVSSTLRMPAAAVLQRFTQVRNPESFTQPAHSLHGSCNPIHFWVNENQSYPYLNPLSTHSLRTIRLHSLQESSGSNRETIETHSFTPSDFNSTMKSYTQHIKANV
jgi:hypothetical protein